MRIEKIILESVKKNKSLKELALETHYSIKQISRICKCKFNHTYKELQLHQMAAQILGLADEKMGSQMIADKFFHGNVSQLYKYVNRFSNVPLKKIKIIGGRRMNKNKKMILEAQVISTLVSNIEGGNLTLNQLGVPKCIIVSLRQKGYDIISVPGRYNGGYNLGQSSKDICLDWINKIRKNRYNLPTNYTF